MPPGPEAWHEAGHALAARLAGGRVLLVTLESEREEHEGHVEVDWSGVGAGPEARARLNALVALAGPLAELLREGEHVLADPDVLSSWRGDWSEARATLAEFELDPSEVERQLERLARELRTWFEDPRAEEQLARIADALDAHGTLDETLLADALD